MAGGRTVVAWQGRETHPDRRCSSVVHPASPAARTGREHLRRARVRRRRGARDSWWTELRRGRSDEQRDEV